MIYLILPQAASKKQDEEDEEGADVEAEEEPVKKPKKPAKGNVLVAARKPGKGLQEIVKEYKEITKKYADKIKSQRVLKDKFDSTKQAVVEAGKFPDNIKKLKVRENPIHNSISLIDTHTYR